LADDVQIVLSELVTNAIRHAGTDVTVTLEVGDGHLRVEVGDGDIRPPAMPAADLDAASGRGLFIVSALARAWRYERTERDGISGKTVSADFDRASAGASTASSTSSTAMVPCANDPSDEASRGASEDDGCEPRHQPTISESGEADDDSAHVLSTPMGAPTTSSTTVPPTVGGQRCGSYDD
jgi:hypothetical protein